MLTFSMWGSTPQIKTEKILIKRFEKENPGIKIKVLHVPSYGDYGKKMLLLAAGNESPDVMMTPHENVFAWADKGLLLPLDKMIKKEEN